MPVERPDPIDLLRDALAGLEDAPGSLEAVLTEAAAPSPDRPARLRAAIEGCGDG